jgi:hypothetical protein
MVRRIPRPVLVTAIAVAIALALALTLRDARASSPTRELPDVVADSPDNISLAVSEETPTGGHMEPELLLRFNGYVHNIGPGALDFRGSRGTPDPQEPATPPMNVFQRVYNSDGTYSEEPSSAQMIYVNADGHHHWHLQHVAYYSLWNAQQSAEVAPAQKVGFCLEDSQRMEETGPEKAVYSDEEDAPFGSREFCRQYQPEATDVYEGISEGWRDVYESNLAFQWVDVSNVAPGEYWLRAEADPEHFIQEAPGPKPPAFAERATVVPGFDATAQSDEVEIGHSERIQLTSKKWEGQEYDERPSDSPVYELVTPPAHGTLGAIEGDQVEYSPAPGYSGPDSFTFAARDPKSAFPQSPAVASVSLEVGEHRPSVAIEGAPTSMVAGTSISLSASVENDPDEVKWSSSFPTILPTGPTTATYTAPSTPPPGGFVTVTAESAHGGRDQRTIEIRPYVAPGPNPEVPPATVTTPTPTPGKHGVTSAVALSTPTAMLIGRKLYLTATAGQAGRLRLTAILRGHKLGSCVTQVRRHQAFTCTTTLPRGISPRARIGVWATLRVGRRLIQTVRRPAPVPSEMKAMAAASWRGIQAAWRYLCGG